LTWPTGIQNSIQLNMHTAPGLKSNHRHCKCNHTTDLMISVYIQNHNPLSKFTPHLPSAGSSIKWKRMLPAGSPTKWKHKCTIQSRVIHSSLKLKIYNSSIEIDLRTVKTASQTLATIVSQLRPSSHNRLIEDQLNDGRRSFRVVLSMMHTLEM